jgi:von Willebrand factor A domain-containing protein 8
MFFPITSLPMSQNEEASLLLQTGCSQELVDTLINFAEKYRSSMTSDLVQKNRKLGTRALIRIARRLAKYPDYADLYTIMSRAVLSEFLPTAERMSLDTVFDELNIKKLTPPVRL